MLPPELQDLTIDHLHDDKATLAQCVLVCRDWMHSARHHLWHTIRLNLATEQIDTKVLPPLNTPDIAFHVRSIVVTSGSAASEAKVRPEMDIHLLHNLLTILSPYSRLHSFTLENITFGPDCCDTPGCNVVGPPSIRNIALVDVAFDALREVKWLWCAFPSADRFQLDRVWWRPWGQADGRTESALIEHAPRPSYKELALGHCCSRDTVAKWLLGVSPSLDIQTLRLPLIGIHDEFLVELLRSIGVSLHHLEIGSLGHVKSSKRYSNYFDFSANTELKSISIGVPMYRDPDTVLDWLITILSHIVSTTVTRITLSIYPIHKTQNARALLTTFNWSALVSVVERPQFARLRHIIFRLAGQAEYLKHPHNFVPLNPILSEVVLGHFDCLRNKGVNVSIV